MDVKITIVLKVTQGMITGANVEGPLQDRFTMYGGLKLAEKTLDGYYKQFETEKKEPSRIVTPELVVATKKVN